MAGKKSILFRLVSSAGTGYFYIGSKPNTYPPVNWVPSSKSWPWGNTIPWSMSTSSSTRWRCRRVRNARDSLQHIPYTLHKQHPSTHIKPNSKERNVSDLSPWKMTDFNNRIKYRSLSPLFSFLPSLQLDRHRPFSPINLGPFGSIKESCLKLFSFSLSYFIYSTAFGSLISIWSVQC